jgi:hypothetical protein
MVFSKTAYWRQARKDGPDGRLEHIVVPANEQNLESLSIEVLRNPNATP